MLHKLIIFLAISLLATSHGKVFRIITIYPKKQYCKIVLAKSFYFHANNSCSSYQCKAVVFALFIHAIFEMIKV